MTADDTPRYPRLKPQVEISPVASRPGSVCLRATPGGVEFEMDAGAFMIAQAFDGTRSLAQIGADIEDDGAHRGGARKAEGLAAFLEDLGAIDYLSIPLDPSRSAPRPLETTLTPLRHRCQMCGRSCQGQYTGPLDRDFLARLPDLHLAMSERYPDLVDEPPLRHLGPGGSIAALAVRGVEESCLYRGESGQCRIHEAFGAEAKPLICRLFPLVRVMTETGVRVGISPRCYTWHQSFDQGPAQSAVEMTGVATLPWPIIHAMDTTPPGDAPRRRFIGEGLPEALADEAALLSSLKAPDADFWEVLSVACANYLRRGPLCIDKLAFSKIVRPHLAALGESLTSECGSLPDPPPPLSHLEEVAGLAAALRSLPEHPFEGLDPELLPYALRVVGQFVYLREWSYHPSFHAGALVMLTGVAAAAWSAADRDTFARRLAAWVRVLRLHDNVLRLFPDEATLRSALEGFTRRRGE